MSAAWSYVLTAVGVLGLYLAGRMLWWAWLIGLGAQGLWVAYAVATEQWGFIISAVAYGWVYARNAGAWRRDRIHAGHAPLCAGNDDWHNPSNGHCGDCGCIACTLATTR